MKKIQLDGNDYLKGRTWGRDHDQIPEEEYPHTAQLSDYEMFLVDSHRGSWLYRVGKEKYRLGDLIEKYRKGVKDDLHDSA